MPIIRKGPEVVRPDEVSPRQVQVAGGPAWRGAYDPMKFGARCHECPLREAHQAVPPKGPWDSPVAIVGEAPGRHEVAALSPFVGQSGQLLRDMLYESWKLLPRGVKRWTYDDFWITNVLLHKPSGQQDLMLYLKGLERWNKTERSKLKKEGREYEFVKREDPVKCCLPRLLYELKDRKVIILVGKLALRQADPKRDSIVMWRGSPFQWDIEKALGDLVMRGEAS